MSECEPLPVEVLGFPRPDIGFYTCEHGNAPGNDECDEYATHEYETGLGPGVMWRSCCQHADRDAPCRATVASDGV